VVEWERLEVAPERRCDATAKCQRCRETVPSFGYDDQTRLWCKTCAVVEWERLEVAHDRRCDARAKCTKGCGNYASLVAYYRGYCLACFQREYPDEPVNGSMARS
jgi:hypothetical protein